MKNNLRIVAAQINTLVGDIYGNAQKIIDSAGRVEKYNRRYASFNAAKKQETSKP